jgi:hypothetical protein
MLQTMVGSVTEKQATKQSQNGTSGSRLNLKIPPEARRSEVFCL